MSLFTTPFAAGPIVSGDPRGATADWARSYAAGRLAGLALAFCLAPFLLVLPGAGREALPVLTAALASAALGLVALKLPGGCRQVAATGGLGYAALAAGLWSGLSPAAVAVAAMALAIDLIICPREDRATPGSLATLGAAVALAGALGLALAAAPAAGALQGGLAALILPLPALVTLALRMQSLGARAAAHSAETRGALQREKAMLDAAEAAVVIVDRGGQAVDATAAGAALMKVDPAGLLGRGFVERVLIADRPAFLKAVSDVAQGGVQRLSLRLNDGTGYAPFALEMRPSDLAGGAVTVRIAAAGAEPSEAGERAPLFAALSHEVRTPFNAILGFSEMLANPALCPREPDKIAEYARIIHRSAQGSFAVTRAVVDLLRVESTRFAAAEEPVDAGEMLRAAIHQATARECDGRITAELSGEAALDAINADPRALRMLFGALIEGFAAAVGAPAHIRCRLATYGLRPELEIDIDAVGARPAHHAHQAFVGVVAILCRRLAEAIDAELELTPRGDGWSARLLFAIPGSVSVLRPPARAVAASAAPSNVLPLRKSA